MSITDSSSGGLKPTLGLVGITINAMALIAPGAFLWTTYQLQSPKASAPNMWSAIAVSTAIALITASCFATLSKAYPEAGAGSSYYYAEAAVIAQEEHKHFRLARLAKFVTGWASHLYYWVYPGVMVGFIGTLIVYIAQLFNPTFGLNPDGSPNALVQGSICFIFAGMVGFIALMGVTGSTLINIIINIVQIVSLVVLSLLFIVYRLGHPQVAYEHPNAISVVLPHDFQGFLFQSTIAILLLVGFESATALAGEAINPKRDVPRGVILSLFIQACICYFFEYFAANFFIGNQLQALVDKNGANPIFLSAAAATKNLPDLTKVDITQIPGYDAAKYAGGKLVSGFDAAAASGAPIGEMSKILGDTLLGGNGFALTLILALTVLMALVGTTLSSLATGVRISYAMGEDRELPVIFGFLHGKYNTPHIGIIVLALLSAAIGAYGVLSVNNLTQVTLISNIGTFIFYGISCLLTLVASLDHLLGDETNVWQTKILPLLGTLLNFAMLFGVFYYGFTAGGDSAKNCQIAVGISVAFFVGGFAYLIGNSLIKGQPLFLPPHISHPQRERIGIKK